MLEWHFVLHNFPESSVYNGGIYHGKLSFPERYPFSPPSLMMLTPSGRLETKQRLCLSMTDFHPESWNPAWSVESILVGLISFMVDERDPVGLGVVSASPESRRRLAAASREFNLGNPQFRELFPELACEGTASASSSSVKPLPPKSDEQGGISALSVEEDEKGATVCNETSDARDEAAQVPRSMSLDRATGGTVFAVPQEAEVAAEIVGKSGKEPALSRSDAHSASGEEQEVEECWICREDGSQEPLIRPCACRGSMDGVHASCVEAWVNHHRSRATGAELPKCSVCGQTYSGTERRPGLAGFARHICADFWRQAIRSGILVTVLVCYWIGAQEEWVVIWVRVPLLVVAGVFLLHKALVLVLSLPYSHPPPQNACCRRLYTEDMRLVAIHIAEFVSVLVIAALWYFYGQIDWYYVASLCCLALVPLFTTLMRQGSQACSIRSLRYLALILLSPIILLVFIIKLLCQNPRRLADPTDGLLHLFVALITISLSFIHSNAPVLITWAVHCGVLLIGIADKFAIRKVTWKEGRIWWIFMQTALVSAYVANLLHGFSEGFFVEQSMLVVFFASILWLILCCTLSISVNWGLCIQQYRRWQNRNGSFTLNPTISAVPPTLVGVPAANAPPAVSAGAAFARGDAEV